jgi:hypothetical protein
MSQPAEAVLELLGAFGRQSPAALRLARVAALAARVEPELLRALRLRLVPEADSGAEADLWFSPLVQVQGASALVLEPEVVEALRQELAGDQPLLDRAWDELQRVHRDAPATVRLEEEVTYLALSNREDAAARIDELLRSAVVALVREDRRGLADWALRALPRLPPRALETEAAWMLALGAGSRLGGRRILGDLPGNTLPGWLPWVMADGMPMAPVGVRLVGQVVELGPPTLDGAHSIEVPRTSPLLIELSWRDDRERAVLVKLRAGRSQAVQVGPGDVRLRSATGVTWTLRRGASLGRKVYLSYSHTDAQDVGRLRHDLEAHGYLVWTDQAIRAGELWDVAIERAIRDTDVFIAVLTPRTVRAKFFRDEIVLALNEGKLVVPVMLAPDVTPPLVLARLQSVDFTRGYEEGLRGLLRALAGDKEAARPARPALPPPLDFSELIAAKTAGFVGRQWLASQIDRWLTAEQGQGLLLVGEPGIGKSAVVAWLSRTRSDIIGVHFCTQANAISLDPHRFVTSLAAQLASQIPALEREVAARFPDMERASATDAFRELIAEPARRLAPPGTRLILVDALDEAARPGQGETIIDVLARGISELPPWLRVLGTTRAEQAVLGRLGAWRILMLDSPENGADVEEYIRHRLAGPEFAGQLLTEAGAVRARVENLAGGNFLHARLTLDALALRDVSPETLGGAPAMAGFYHNLFARYFPDVREYDRAYAPLLRTLIEAPGPVNLQQLTRAGGEEAVRRLGILRPLLRVSGQGGEATYALFHESLRDWLTDQDAAGPYWCGLGKIEEVHCTVVAPAQVAAGSSGLIDVWFHLEEQQEEMVRLAREAGGDDVSLRSRVIVGLSRGTVVQVRLEVEGLGIDHPEGQLVWKGTVASASFPVRAAPETIAGTKIGRVTLHTAGVLVAAVRFKLTVAQGDAPPPAPVPRWRKVFASYAAADRAEVLRRVMVLHRILPRCEVFLDEGSLRAGEDWAARIEQEIEQSDAFLLFWSRNARQSEWVEREWRHALRVRGLDFIMPVLLDDLTEAPPPAELAELHFGDHRLGFLKGKTEPEQQE